MKRFICLLTVMMICIATITVALAQPEDYVGKKMWDFTVSTTSGKKFSLSESLKTHDLVIVNFWATWCPPCKAEFPYLEEAWEKYKDKIDVISLSVEASDTNKKLWEFAHNNKLNFYIGRDESNLFNRIGGKYIPTTLIVGKDRKILSVEVGGKSSVSAFTSWFDKYLSTK